MVIEEEQHWQEICWAGSVELLHTLHMRIMTIGPAGFKSL